ncbi:MAG: glycosyltransferase family 4 protein [Alphaproteobacteria bacterium]|nr:glycosyltransferase family 4 protein [Alphaproteobacteria bacterium]
MRIVNVMISRVKGGIEQAFLDYTQALQLYNHQICAVVDMHCKLLQELQTLNPADIVRIPFTHYNWLLVPYLYFRLKKFAPDLIIVHNKKAINIFKAVARLLGAKIVAVSHNPKFRHVDKCDGIFTITDYQHNIFKQKGYPAERIFTIPNLISEKREFTPPQFHNPPIIGTMGRFDPMKGFPEFIEALSLLKEQNIAFKAVIGGAPQDSYRAEYEKICRMIKQNKLENEVKLLGWIKDKTEFFDNIDIFVLPSRFEPFGIVLLEAMLHGKPVVSSLAEGPAEIFAEHRDAAYLFAIGDVRAMAEQLASAVQNPQQAEHIAANGYNLCRKKYSLEVVAAKLNAAIEHFAPQKENK